MDKKLFSRRNFLKGTAAGTLSLAAAGLLNNAIAEEEGMYVPGTYSATATGMGQVTVEMTFDANSIIDVKVDVANETPGLGAAIGDQMAQAILANQSAELDAVTGVTVTSTAVAQAAAACIAQASKATVDTGAVAA